MARLSGKSGTVTVGGTAVKGVKSWDIDAKCDAIDVTGMDSLGAKAFINGLTEWSGTVECLLDADGYVAVGSLVAGAIAVSLVSASAAPKVTASGSAIVTGYKISTPVEGFVSLSLAFQGTGALTVTVAAT